MTVEQLLNKLIEKGWRPYEDRYVKRAKFGYSVHFIVRPIVNFVLEGYAEATVPLKELLTSKESGFRQFVCENHLYIYKMGENKNFIQDHFKNEYNECCYQYLYDKSCYEYYIIESSLKDKNELEEFLLQNIRIEDESNQNT